PPAVTGSGASDLDTVRSGRAVGALTVVAAVAVLFAVDDSVDVVATVAVLLMIVPPGTPAPTATTSVNVADVAALSDGSVAVTVPEAPTAGVDAVQPAGAEKETNVVFGGTPSVSETFAAA